MRFRFFNCPHPHQGSTSLNHCVILLYICSDLKQRVLCTETARVELIDDGLAARGPVSPLLIRSRRLVVGLYRETLGCSPNEGMTDRCRKPGLEIFRESARGRAGFEEKVGLPTERVIITEIGM